MPANVGPKDTTPGYGRPGGRPDGFCHECKERPAEHFTVSKVIGAVGVPYPAIVWRAFYSERGKLCKPCAIRLAEEKTARGDRN